MSTLELLNTSLFKVTGWTMIHSAWQFLALFVVLKCLLFVINKSHSNLRYLTGIGVMIGAVIISGFTFWHEYQLYFGNEAVAFSNKIIAQKNIVVQNIYPTLTNPNSTTPTKLALLNYLDIVSPYLTMVWIVGMLFYLLKIINGSVYLYRLRNLQPGSYPAVTEMLLQLREKMQVDRFIKLIISNAITEPLTFGNLKPIILLPVSYIANVPMDQLEMILAHELAHIKRYDYVVNLVQTTLEAIFFFNPFFKFISNTTRNEREFCCDDMAASYCGDEKTMAIALANLKIIKSYLRLSLAASATASVFQSRIHRLTTPAYPSRVSVKTFLLALIMVLLAFIYLTKLINRHTENRLASAIKSVKQTYTGKLSVVPANSPGLIVKANAVGSYPIGDKAKRPSSIAVSDTLRDQHLMLPKSAVIASSLRDTKLYTDTAEYRPRAAGVSLDATTDILLNKMNDFKVDSIGRIFYKEEEITNFTLNGKPWPRQKLQVKYIPAIEIARVQISSSSNTTTKVMNIDLKKAQSQTIEKYLQSNY